MGLLKKKLNYDTKTISQNLKKFMDICDSADAAIVSTVDGHLIEKLERESYPVGRIATMGSSMMSLADTMTAELKMGGCKKLIVENEKGILLMMHVTGELVLVCITHDADSLGMMVSFSRNCAESIRNALAS